MKIRISERAKQVVSAVAPALGAALGGPLGGLAGNVLAAAVGGDGNVEAALLAQKPEVIAAIRKADQEFEAQMRAMDIDLERISMADRSSARELAKVNMKPQLWISAIFLGGYFGVLILRMIGILTVSKEDQETLNALFGVLTTGVPLILMFWFGSTAGSAMKSEMLARSKPIDG